MHGIANVSYQLGQARYTVNTPGFVEAVAAAYATQQRPLCLCAGRGIAMYVARLAGPDGGFILKRMPGTGDQHAPTCPSHEPPADLSGLGQLLGTAITEDPTTGETALKLGFSMTKIGGRSTLTGSGTPGDSVRGNGMTLSLRGLLHYLWNQAELTRWHPSFTGKRAWTTVRHRLLQAAENKIACNGALHDRLFIPEPFSVDQRDAINARRIAQWAPSVAKPGKPQSLMMLIAEVKEIVPARYGFKMVIKHMPDQAFAMDASLFRRLAKRFGAELAWWGATDALHMVVIATFGVSAIGLPTIEEMSLMPVTVHWLPVEDGSDHQLIERLVHEGRRFTKGLRFNLAMDISISAATLTDMGISPVVMSIKRHHDAGEHESSTPTSVSAECTWPNWLWRVADGPMPQLPTRDD